MRSKKITNEIGQDINYNHSYDRIVEQALTIGFSTDGDCEEWILSEMDRLDSLVKSRPELFLKSSLPMRLRK